jgi:hypothetical protein
VAVRGRFGRRWKWRHHKTTRQSSAKRRPSSLAIGLGLPMNFPSSNGSPWRHPICAFSTEMPASWRGPLSFRT